MFFMLLTLFVFSPSHSDAPISIQNSVRSRSLSPGMMANKYGFLLLSKINHDN